MRNTIILLGLALFSRSIGRAESLTYTQTIVANGTLGGTDFTSQLVTFTETADSSNVSLFDGDTGVYDNMGTVTVSIPTVGTATFTDQVFVFVNQNYSEAGFYDNTIPSPLSTNSNSALSTYGLTTSIGPLVGIETLATGLNFATTDGNLNFTSEGAGDGTFTVTGSAVPEPGALSMLVLGVVGLLTTRRLRIHS